MIEEPEPMGDCTFVKVEFYQKMNVFEAQMPIQKYQCLPILLDR